MNDKYHKETIDVWKIKVIVQVIMPIDHSKQDQHNQRKQLNCCDHTDANNEKTAESNDDEETKVIMSTNDPLKQDPHDQWK